MRTIVALAIAGGLAGALWWWLAACSVPPEPPRASSANVARLQPAAVAEPKKTDPPARVAVTPPPPEEASAPADDGLTTYHVLVLRAADDAPVAGAELCWLPRDFDVFALSADAREQMAADRASFGRAHGLHAVTGTDGRASLRADPDGVEVTAWSAALFGSRFVSANEANAAAPHDLTIVLREDREVIVRALDIDGRPLPDVRIELRRDAAGGASALTSSIGPTDSHGTARFHHAQQWALPDHDSVPGSAAVVLFGGNGPPTAIDFAALPSEPLEVRAPPFGTLDIALLGPDRRPWPLGSASRWQVWITPGDWTSGASSGSRDAVSLDEHGRALASPVRCGMAFRVRFATIETRVIGPRVQGECVHVELTVSGDTPIVVARLLHPDGTPLHGEGTLAYESEHGGGSQQVGTEDDGRIRVPLRAAMVGTTPTLTFFQRPSPPQPMTAAGEVKLTQPLVAGFDDIGDLVIGPVPVLVAGRVETTGGAPVPKPIVRVDRTQRNSGTWAGAWELRTELLGDGRFVVHGLVQDRSYRLEVAGDFAPLDPIPFEPGTRDLVIRVQRAGSVRATFVVDDRLADAVRSRRIEIRLQPEPPPQPTDTNPMAELQRAARATTYPRIADHVATCTWQPLTPGRYRLTACCAGIDEPIVDLPGIAVPDGPADDDRLHDIDLRGRVRPVVVTVLDESGAPLRDDAAAVLLCGPATPDREWYGRSLDGDDGSIELMLSRPVDLQIIAPGYPLTRVAGVFADLAVTLHRAAVPVRIDPPLDLRDGDVATLFVQAVSTPGPSCRVHDAAGGTQSGRLWQLTGGHSQHLDLVADRGRLAIEGGGRRSVTLVLKRAARTAAVSPQPAEVDLDTLRATEELVLHVDPEAVASAMAALGR